MVKTKQPLEQDKVTKIVINVGVGRLSSQSSFDEKILPGIIKDLSLITGQRPVVCKAKKSIAGFKIRAGQAVGLKVTLRGHRMADFLERLIKITLPRLRDFRGVDFKNIDSGGNLTIGLKEQTVFSEITPENSLIDFGLEITIVSNAKDKEGAIELYKKLKIPLKK